MKKLNLFEVYEASLENALQNDIMFDATYIIEYVEGALDSHISGDLADKILSAHKDWENSEKGSHNKYVMLQKPLENIEIDY